jgi:NADPH-dependent 2,4-dienoyl-CoA reductase/sulfur reductase-like enzyme
MEKKDVIIIGGGPAGLAAAVELYKKGIRDILILEREKHMGGILRQCIHDGFGLTRFQTTLSGPEYAQRFIDQVVEKEIPYMTNTTVLEVTKDKVVTAASREGLVQYQAQAVILTMGCRERTRGALGIPGERPTGVFTAGVAQAYMNLYNRMPAKEVVILGSGDIGMIMARRLTLEGAHVQAVFEIQPIPSGLPRNIEQCLNDYNIPLYLSHTVTEIHGDSRLTGVTVAQVDEHFKPVPGTEKEYQCDTLILSVGLIPENELSIDAGVTLDNRTRGAVVDEHFQTNIDGIFAAGNVLHVHDLVDFVSMEAEKLADSAAEYIKNKALEDCSIEITTDGNIGHTIPQKISGEQDVTLSMRVRKLIRDCRIVVRQGGKEIGAKKMKKALPAEMIQLTIKADKISSKDALEVSVEC